MPNPGYVHGTHHLTFCVGGAQEDYDFHVRLLGLKSVKKTVLFDGEIPIYHLYYGNRLGDASTLLTAFPYRQAGWMGKRGTNQMKTLLLSVPVDSIGFWADRLQRAPASRPPARELFGTERLELPAPVRHPLRDRRRPRSRLARALLGRGRADRARDPRRLRDHDLGARARAADVLSHRGAERQAAVLRGRRITSSSSATTHGHGRYLELVEEPDLPQGTWHFGEGTIHHHALDAGTAENQRGGQGLHRRPRLHRRLRRQGPRLLLLGLHAQPRRRPDRARPRDAAGLPDRRVRGRARDAHVHPAALGEPAQRDLAARAHRDRSRP